MYVRYAVTCKINKTPGDRVVFSQLEIFSRSDRFECVRCHRLLATVPIELTAVFCSVQRSFYLSRSLYQCIVSGGLYSLIWCVFVLFYYFFWFVHSMNFSALQFSDFSVFNFCLRKSKSNNFFGKFSSILVVLLII